MRLAGKLIIIVIPTAVALLSGLAVGVVLTVRNSESSASATIAQRMGEQAAYTTERSAKRLEEHGRSLATVVAQVAPSFVVSDDLSTLEALVVQLAADPDVGWVQLTDAKGRALAAAWPGGKGVKTAAAAKAKLGNTVRVTTAITAEGTTYGMVEVLLIRARLEADGNRAAAESAKLTEATRNELATLRNRVVLVVVGASTAILVVLAVAFGLLIRRQVSRPLAELKHLATAIAAGDLSQRVTVRSRDEVGDLADALNRMALQLDAKGRLAEAIADGNLGVEVPIASERDSLGKALARMTSSLKERIGGLASQADRLAAMATALVEASARLDRSLATAGANIQSVAAAMQEFQVSFREISTGSNKAVGLTRDVSDNASRASDGTAALISAGQEVGEIARVIASVAQRTNLLALNATREAARAGVAGRGFAVVAGEVKSLANETSASTTTINTRVERITTETVRARDALATIATAVKRVDETLQTIAASIEEQTATSDEVARSLTGLGDATRVAAEASTSLSGSTRELAALAGSLREMAGAYRL